ncbi:MAG TPA: immunity protein YezG family protein [Advenella sp.]|nr:immunity protein YezG family protein [Advenella sp.]
MEQQLRELNDLQRDIAQDIYSIELDQPWIEARATIKCIFGYMEGQVVLRMQDGSRKTSVTSLAGDMLIEKLRTAMADFNQGQAWYTMVVTVQEDGKFKFDFDYDHLPTFDILPDPEDWEKEFKVYPNPALQAHVQDWMDGRVKDEDWRTVIQRLRDLNPSLINSIGK